MTDIGFAYLSHNRFLGAPALAQRPQAPYVVAGVPWDGSTTNRPGARLGPRALRDASLMLCDAEHPVFDVSPLPYLADVGDLRLPNTSLDGMRAALEGQARELIQDRHVIWLGGDHAITLSTLRALRAREGRPLALIHFDAHCDTWGDHFGEPSGHGTWVAEAMEEGLLVPPATMQIGIRSAADRQAREYVAQRGGVIYTARDLRGLDGPRQLAGVIAEMDARLAQAQAPVYLSLDIDCLDPAFAPGTGTPEPGGLSSSQALTLMEGLAALPHRFVGMDCVEVSPPFDHAELTSLAGATLVWTYLCARLSASGDPSTGRPAAVRPAGTP